MSVAMLRSSPVAEVKVPKTPMRRFLCGKVDLFRPSLTLGKRDRDHNNNVPAAQIASETMMERFLGRRPMSMDSIKPMTLANESLESLSLSSSFEKNHERACLAIQHHDKPLDAVVITTLPRYPFCCHEDLLTMSRAQLVEAATLFNNYLPQNAQIDCSELATDANIRHCIETMVGIIPEIPGAPKAVKSRLNDNISMATLFEDALLDSLPSPPSSPLAMRLPRKRGLSNITMPLRLLGRLEEKDEADFFVKQRTTKKRKVSQSIAEPTRFLFEDDMEMTPAPRLSFSTSMEMFSPGVVEDAISKDHDMIFFSPLRDPPSAVPHTYTPHKITSGKASCNARKSALKLKARAAEPEDTTSPTLACEDFARMDVS
ncbi:hypothetical protein D9613_012319 [Agrocybe pediades]|uniref:Uncharacterized protein n=1 Tax=Agrocybe pediades TaxID=84607 RepID=A0A8H4QFN8_9AGAR|nr:hypothetical protein D9613_012319 [Agrocybe pediades]